MSRESIVFIVGILLLLVPYLGIPTAWKTYTITGVAVLLVFIGYSLRRSSYMRSIEKGNGQREADTFVERVQEK